MDEDGIQDILQGILCDQNGQVIRRDHRKIILKVDVREGMAFPLFVKIHKREGLLRSVRETLTVSAGERELRIARLLASSGVPVPEPIGSATERSAAGLVTRSLFAARWQSDTISLRDYARSLYRSGRAEASAVDALNRSLGSFVFHLHRRGVLSRDMNEGNFLVRRRDDGSFSIFLVDFESVDIGGQMPLKRRISNLTQIAAFMLQMNKHAAEEICAGYAALDASLDAQSLTQEVQGRALRLSSLWERELNDRFSRIGSAREGENA